MREKEGEKKSRQGCLLPGLETQHNFSLNWPGFALQLGGLQELPTPFRISFQWRQWFLAGSEVTNIGDRPSVWMSGWLPQKPRQGHKLRPVGQLLLDRNSQAVWPAVDIRNQPGAGPEGAWHRLSRPECQLHRCLNLRRCGLIDLGAKWGEGFQPLGFEKKSSIC